MHNDPNDRDYVSCTVLMREKRTFREGGKNYHRIRIPVWQQYIGNRHGQPWMPRQGDFVYVAFFKNEKAFIVAAAYNFQARPVCMPGSDLDKICKTCQWERATKRNKTGEFTEIPEGKKPKCNKWFHGPNTDKPTIGRDLMEVYDYCQQGDEDPTCQKCDSIDFVKRCKNSWRKAYSANTMSCQAPNRRLEDHVYCGSYLRYESEAGNSIEYSEGCGHIRLGNATCESCKKAHINYRPDGTVDVHAEHEEVAWENESKGARISVVSNENSSLIAVESIYFDESSYIRIMKDGQIIISTPKKITIESTAADVLIKAKTQIELNAPLVLATTGLFHVTGDETVDGTCDGTNNIE